MKLSKKSGFTLLEIIIVIIIVGVLASLALPRFFATVEYSRSTEALNALTSVRQSIERCYLTAGGSYNGCSMGGLDLEDPGNSPGAHFTYNITGQDATSYTITATRNTVDGGNSAAVIVLYQDTGGVTKGGTGEFSGIK